MHFSSLKRKHIIVIIILLTIFLNACLFLTVNKVSAPSYSPKNKLIVHNSQYNFTIKQQPYIIHDPFSPKHPPKDTNHNPKPALANNLTLPSSPAKKYTTNKIFITPSKTSQIIPLKLTSIIYNHNEYNAIIEYNNKSFVTKAGNHFSQYNVLSINKNSIKLQSNTGTILVYHLKGF